MHAWFKSKQIHLGHIEGAGMDPFAGSALAYHILDSWMFLSGLLNSDVGHPYRQEA